MAGPGYDWASGHPQRRAAWARRLRDIGPVRCGCTGECLTHEGQCQVVINDGDTWHLGHNEGGIRAGDTGDNSSPWCVPCNLRDAANATNGRSKPEVTAREW